MLASSRRGGPAAVHASSVRRCRNDGLVANSAATGARSVDISWHCAKVVVSYARNTPSCTLGRSCAVLVAAATTCLPYIQARITPRSISPVSSAVPWPGPTRPSRVPRTSYLFKSTWEDSSHRNIVPVCHRSGWRRVSRPSPWGRDRRMPRATRRRRAGWWPSWPPPSTRVACRHRCLPPAPSITRDTYNIKMMRVRTTHKNEMPNPRGGGIREATDRAYKQITGARVHGCVRQRL